MKIEMGESLVYSWLRHVKGCQLVQANWKPSNQWARWDDDELRALMGLAQEKLSPEGYDAFRSNTFEQLLKQAEIDVLGAAVTDGSMDVFAVEVAFHENGLNYGGTHETVQRVMKKWLRAAMAVRGYLGAQSGQVIFASPKVNPVVLTPLRAGLDAVNELLDAARIGIEARLVVNEEFRTEILEPVMEITGEVSDTSELFVRAYQLSSMFDTDVARRGVGVPSADSVRGGEDKIGKIARKRLWDALQSGLATPKEVELMQTKEYSARVFGLSFPLLVAADSDYERVRYYVDPIYIHGREYRMTSQWYEHRSRELLLEWLERKAAENEALGR